MGIGVVVYFAYGFYHSHLGLGTTSEKDAEIVDDRP
jgi:hypothetical protein